MPGQGGNPLTPQHREVTELRRRSALPRIQRMAASVQTIKTFHLAPKYKDWNGRGERVQSTRVAARKRQRCNRAGTTTETAHARPVTALCTRLLHRRERYKRSVKPLASSSTVTCANQMTSSFFWYKDGGHIVRHQCTLKPSN